MTLTTAYTCILIAALLPYLWVSIAKFGARDYNNHNPRAWMASQEGDGKRQRANAAHLNAFEAFAPFAAAVLMAQLAGVAHDRIALLAVLFVGLRIVHGILYIADKQAIRSLVWACGIACVVALMGLAIARIA